MKKTTLFMRLVFVCAMVLICAEAFAATATNSFIWHDRGLFARLFNK